jgi:pseudaminic acid biosynthesis-associated methylase
MNELPSMSSSKEKPDEISSEPTAQEIVWKGNFGRDYTDRNRFETQALDELWLRNYGIARSTINAQFLSGVAKTASFLEVGCNAGNQLLLLKEMGWSNLSGTELQPYAIEIARSRLPGISVKQGSALALPWTDSSFDVVFTSGVLIHISPDDLAQAMDELHRISKAYIWCSEYYAPQVAQITYRDRGELLWKMDFARTFLDRFPDLELVKETRLQYLQNANVDTVFLLKKKLSPST